jgi:hypothetical protein
MLGLLMSGLILTLLAFGVSGVLIVGGNTDLMYLLWPASSMLIVGWHTTPLGILITIASVVINCAMYIVIVLGLRAAVLSLLRRGSPRVIG